MKLEGERHPAGAEGGSARENLTLVALGVDPDEIDPLRIDAAFDQVVEGHRLDGDRSSSLDRVRARQLPDDLVRARVADVEMEERGAYGVRSGPGSR